MTNFVNINQKMCSFIHFGETLGLRRLTIHLDHLPSKNYTNGDELR